MVVLRTVGLGFVAMVLSMTSAPAAETLQALPLAVGAALENKAEAIKASIRVKAEIIDRLVNQDAPPYFGNPEGDIKVIVFYDYRCGYCRKSNPRLATCQRIAGAGRCLSAYLSMFVQSLYSRCGNRLYCGQGLQAAAA